MNTRNHGDTATNGLNNPFSDSIDNEKKNIGSVIEIEENDDDDNNDSAEVFKINYKKI